MDDPLMALFELFVLLLLAEVHTNAQRNEAYHLCVLVGN
jgi:hypothetical protein